MKDNNLFEKAVKASARFLELRGYEVVDQNWSPEGSAQSVPLIAYDDDTLVFIDVKVRDNTDGFVPEAKTDREAMESLAETDSEPDFGIRFDIISMMVVGESRALLRHHINAFSEAA